MTHTPQELVPIEVEMKYELEPQEYAAFLGKLQEEMHFQIVMHAIVTDAFSVIEESTVTHGKDFTRYRHTLHEDGRIEIVKQRKWWEVQDGVDLRRETPELPVTEEEYAGLTFLVSLIKKRISLASQGGMHADLDILYDYEPKDLPAERENIPPERLRYFLELEEVVSTKAEMATAKERIKAVFKREFGKEGTQADGMLNMALKRMKNVDSGN